MMSTIYSVPKEVLLHCFSSLPYLALVHCSEVSKMFKEVADDKSLWNSLYSRIWSVAIMSDINYKPRVIEYLKGDIWQEVMPLKNIPLNAYWCSATRCTLAQRFGGVRTQDISNFPTIKGDHAYVLWRAVRQPLIIEFLTVWKEIVVVAALNELYIKNSPKSPPQVYTLDNSQISHLYANHGVLFVGCENGSVEMLNLENPDGLVSLWSHANRVTALHATETLLFSGLENGMIAKWDLKENKCLVVFEAHSKPIQTLETYDLQLFSADQNGIKIWKIGSFDQPIKEIPLPSLTSFTIFGLRLFVLTSDEQAGRIHFYSLETLKQIRSLEIQPCSAKAYLKFTGTKLAICTDGSVYFFNFTPKT
jgi:WD40 repeat protein